MTARAPRSASLLTIILGMAFTALQVVEYIGSGLLL